jgi:hypothetical protein
VLLDISSREVAPNLPGTTTDAQPGSNRRISLRVREFVETRVCSISRISFLASEKGAAGKAATFRPLLRLARLTQREFRDFAPVIQERGARWTSTRTLGRLRGQVKDMIGVCGSSNHFATAVKPDIAVGGVVRSARCYGCYVKGDC